MNTPLHHLPIRSPPSLLTVLPSPEEREKLTKVLIVGAMPTQAQGLLAEYSSTLKLRFWAQEGPRTLRSLIRSSKLIILMADKIKHSVQDTVKSYKSDDCDLLIVSGGITNIKLAIQKYCYPPK